MLRSDKYTCAVDLTRPEGRSDRFYGIPVNLCVNQLKMDKQRKKTWVKMIKIKIQFILFFISNITE